VLDAAEGTVQRVLTAQFVIVVLALSGCRSTRQEITGPSSAKCTVEVSASPATFDAAGGSGRLSITAERECRWTAVSDAVWLTLTSSGDGQGSGTVEFAVARTDDPVARTASLTAADKQIQITQRAAVCRYQLSRSHTILPASGGAADVDVAASSALCEWSARGEADWISIKAGANGRGYGRVTFEAAQTTGPARTGRLVIADQAVNVTQGDGCVYSLAPSEASAAAAGGTGSVSVNTAPGCPWSAVSAVSWLTVTAAGSGSGPGVVQFSTTSNSGPARSGALTIAGRQLTVRQASGCTFSVAPTHGSYPAAGGASTIAVSTAAGCQWISTSQADWITVTAGATGSGPGVVSLIVASSVYVARTGTVSVAGLTFTASQARGCQVELSATSASFGPEGGSGSFQVTTYCPWRTLVEGGDGWMILTRGDRGNGSGPVWFTVAPNDGPARSATLLVEDHHRFTVYQGGR
jgi:hypothetical protein